MAGRTHSPVLSKFQSAWHTGCHRPFTVFPVFAVFMVSLFPPCALHNVRCQPTAPAAMCFGNSGEHGSHCTKCQSSDKSDWSDLSDILCSHPVHCAMCPASLPEAREPVRATADHFGAARLPPDHMPAGLPRRSVAETGATRLQKKLNFF